MSDLRIASLPEGVDPDELIARSPAAWAMTIAIAKPYSQYVLERVLTAPQWADMELVTKACIASLVLLEAEQLRDLRWLPSEPAEVSDRSFNSNWTTYMGDYQEFLDQLMDVKIGQLPIGDNNGVIKVEDARIRGWSTEALTLALSCWHQMVERSLFFGNNYNIKFLLPHADLRIKQLRAELMRRATPKLKAADTAPTVKGYWDAAEVRQKVDPLDIFAQYLTDIEQVRGLEYRATCLFHKAKHTDGRHTPSLFVNVEKGVFICRACQAGGSMFDFVMKLEQLQFAEAVNRVAELGKL